MFTTLEAESTLTDRYQTTVPETVRRALRLNKRDKLQYLIRPSGEVVLTRAHSAQGEDPALLPFLDLLAHDMAAHPERLRPLSEGLAQRVRGLVRDTNVDLNAPLSDQDE
ncbi:MAG: type II toxin-antitoxin system PrlF family antitoxin [Betaproteobacteria bacterium]